MALLTERYFHCPEWPACQCPDGTVSASCPGRTVQEQAVRAASSKTRLVRDDDGVVWEASAGEDVSDWAVEPGTPPDFRVVTRPRKLPASSGEGGPASAPEKQASPAAAAIDPDEAVTDFRAAMASRRGRAISGESLIADINALLERSDRAILELSAIQTELAMIRKDLGDLHGLPID